MFALAAAVALLLSIGAFAAAPARADAPRNQFQYPKVMGVDGSSQSSVDMNLSTSDRFQINIQRVPWLSSSLETKTIAYWRYDGINKDYAPVEGQYCKNKSSGDVFMATGAPADPSLTC